MRSIRYSRNHRGRRVLLATVTCACGCRGTLRTLISENATRAQVLAILAPLEENPCFACVPFGELPAGRT